MEDAQETAAAMEMGTNVAAKGGNVKPEAQVKSSSSKTGMYALFGLFALILVVCAITIPIVLTQDDDEPAVSNKKEIAYLNTTGLFNSSLELVNPDAVNGYKNEEELVVALQNNLNFMLNNIAQENVKLIASGSFATTGEETPELMFESPEATADLASPTGKLTGEGSDFGTNNQEQGVEEGDIIVSDGENVYAAYGKYFVVWDALTGEMKKTIEMPPVNLATDTEGGDVMPASDSESSRSDFYYVPEPWINSLLLHEGRLLVIVSGYADYGISGSARALNDYLATHIRLYDTTALLLSSSNETDTGLVGSLDVNGAYNSIRSVNGFAHIVSTSSMNTYPYLIEPLNPMTLDANITELEYRQKVTEIGIKKRDEFLKELLTNLKAGSDTLPLMTRITLPSETTSNTGVEQQAYYDGLLQSLVLVHSIDMTTQTLGTSLSSSGAFLPASWAQVYGSNEKIVVAATAWEYDAVTGGSAESTALIAFQLTGSSSSPHSIGSVPGSILNSHSLDVLGDILRIAVTVTNDTMIFIEPLVMVEPTDGAVSNETTAPSDRSSAVTIDMDIMPVFVTPDTENYIILMKMPGSDGENPGAMTENGRLKLGKPKERFTSVRFFDTIAYAVTFERTDPFYVLDLSDSTNPKVVAELEITGFSSYLHPINAENTILLGIGQEADANGTTTGTQISLFDVTSPTVPKLLHRHSVEVSEGGYAYSDAEWDFKATRYINGTLFLPMDIYSNTMDGSGGFHGFRMYEIDVTSGITENVSCRVSHSMDMYYPIYFDYTGENTNTVVGDPNATCSYTGGYLPRRSMIFDGNLMTLDQNEILMTDLATCELMWNTTISIPAPCPNDNWGILA